MQVPPGKIGVPGVDMNIEFEPWKFMLAVDGVNYALSERVSFCAGHPRTQITNLSSGVNALEPPVQLVDFALTMARNPLFWHDYDGPDGHLAGRAAIAVHESAQSDGEVRLGPENVIVTAGASSAIMLAGRGLSHLCRLRGRQLRAVVPVPTFPLVGAALVDAGFAVTEVESQTPGRWLPTVPELTAAATADAGVVYINTFNNPTGERYEDDELRELVRWARDNGVYLLHDTVSSDVASIGTIAHLPTIAAREGHADGLITVSSLSKARAIPGFRIGWLIAAESLVGNLSRFNELAAPSSPGIAAPTLVLDRVVALCTAPAEQERPKATATEAMDRLRECLAPYAIAEPRLTPMLDHIATRLDAGDLAEHVAAWRHGLRRLLADNVEVLGTDFADLVPDIPVWRGDFNTFLSFTPLKGRPYLATCHQLFRDYGLQTLPAPAFGKDEAWWRRRPEYFTRLSFAMPTQRWIAGLRRLRLAAGEMSRR